MTLGKSSKWVDESDGSRAAGATTAIAYEQPVARGSVQPEEEFGSEQAGYVWAALEVKVCSTEGQEVYVNNTPWSLAYADGARVEPSSVTYGDFPRPEYPIGDTAVRVGDCVRGKIVFPVPGNQRPERVVYAPPSSDAVEWSVPSV
ncbi:hypothetical protein CCS38_11015 [Streptomyces purpurogeneiscleroticus]|nr:hypothetical protein [Streptomyces purpurogeneiscleroticus]